MDGVVVDAKDVIDANKTNDDHDSPKCPGSLRNKVTSRNEINLLK